MYEFVKDNWLLNFENILDKDLDAFNTETNDDFIIFLRSQN